MRQLYNRPYWYIFSLQGIGIIWGKCQFWKVPSLPALFSNTSGEAHVSLELPMCIEPAGSFLGQERGGSALQTNTFAKETTSTTFAHNTVLHS